MIYTTLNKIKVKIKNKYTWDKLLTHLNKTEPDDEPLSLKTILDINGLSAAIWAAITVEGYDKEIRLFAVACARRVQHLMKDERSINALKVAEKYANGECTKEELDAAREAADDAASAAWNAVGAAKDIDLDATYTAEDAADVATWVASSCATAAALNAAEAARDVVWNSADASESEEIEWQTEEFKRVFCSE